MENSSLIVSTYRAPALEGDIVNFTCANGLVLSGPNATTCMSNGLWEPNPRDVKCKGQHVYNSLVAKTNSITIMFLVIRFMHADAREM